MRIVVVLTKTGERVPNLEGENIVHSLMRAEIDIAPRAEAPKATV